MIDQVSQQDDSYGDSMMQCSECGGRVCELHRGRSAYLEPVYEISRYFMMNRSQSIQRYV